MSYTREHFVTAFERFYIELTFKSFQSACDCESVKSNFLFRLVFVGVDAIFEQWYRIFTFSQNNR